MLESFRIIVKKPQTWIIGLYGSLMYLPLSGFADLWGVPYAMKVFNVDQTTAAGSAFTFYVGIGCGAPLAAHFSDYFQSHLKPIWIGALGTLTFFALILYTPNLTLIWSYPLFFIAGMFSASQFIAFSTISKINPTSISGTATGFHNMICMVTGFLYQPGIGYLLTLHWDGTLENNAPVYSIADYKFAMTIIPIALMISLIASYFIRETFSRGAEAAMVRSGN